MTKKKNLFFSILSTVMLAILVLMAIFFLVFWNYLEAYEKSMPRYAVEQILAEYRQGDFSSAMERAGIAEETLSPKQYAEYVRQTLGTLDEVTVAESKLNSGETVCELRGSAGKGIRFTMEKTQNSVGFGFSAYRAVQEPIALRQYTIVAPADVTVEADGVPLEGGESEFVEAYQGIRKDSLRPTRKRYTLEQFERPEISLRGIPAGEWNLSEKGTVLTVTRTASEEQRQEIEQLALEAARLCARYTSKDATFRELSAVLYQDTEYYDTTRGYSNYWVIDHDSYRFEQEKAENIVRYSDDHFSCEVSFDYVVYKDRSAEGYRPITKKYQAHYRLYFVRVDGKFLVGNAEVF